MKFIVLALSTLVVMLIGLGLYACRFLIGNLYRINKEREYEGLPRLTYGEIIRRLKHDEDLYT